MNNTSTCSQVFVRAFGSAFAAPHLLAFIIGAGGLAYCVAADDDDSPVATAATTDGSADAAAQPKQSLREGLFAEYRLDGDTKDTSGANRDAKLAGPALAFARDRNGKHGRAIELKGDGALEVGEGFQFASFSVSMWIKPAGQQVPYANIIDNNHGDGINWVAQQTDDKLNQYHFGVGKRTERGAKPKGVVVHFSLTPDKWQHLVLVKSSQHVIVYVDGEVVDKATTTPSINYARPPHIRVGSLAGGGRFWKGAIDDVTLHRRTLTQEEIRFLSKPSEPVALAHGPAPDMSGAWVLSNGVVIDVSQNSNTVSWPGMDNGFTYSTVADWDGEKFEGVLVRKSRTNGCSTEMKVLFTPKLDASAEIKTTALDNNCDLRIGFGETFTLKRITPKERAELAAAKQKAVLTAPTVEAAIMLTLQTGQQVTVGMGPREANQFFGLADGETQAPPKKSQKDAESEFNAALVDAARATASLLGPPAGASNPTTAPATTELDLKSTRGLEKSLKGKTKAEVKALMERKPDEAGNPAVWTYRGSWTDLDSEQEFNRVDISFGTGDKALLIYFSKD